MEKRILHPYDLDLRTYFMLWADKNYSDWIYVVDVLERNGVFGVRELCEKETRWRMPLFSENNKAARIASNVMHSYCYAVYAVLSQADGIDGDICVEEYVRKNAPPETSQRIIAHTVRRLQRKQIETMDKLCALPLYTFYESVFFRSRSAELALLMKSKFIAEQSSEYEKHLYDRFYKEINTAALAKATEFRRSVYVYFRENSSDCVSDQYIAGITRALTNAKIEAMEQLCQATLEEISRARGVGNKRLEYIKLMREKYIIYSQK